MTSELSQGGSDVFVTNYVSLPVIVKQLERYKPEPEPEQQQQSSAVSSSAASEADSDDFRLKQSH